MQAISILKSQCLNTTFADKSRYDRLFQKVIQREGESEINYIKIFQNDKALEISVGNNYNEDQLMYTFLGNLHKDGKYPFKIEIHQTELGREEKFVDIK